MTKLKPSIAKKNLSWESNKRDYLCDYKNCFSSIKEFNVLEIDTNNFNIFKDLDKLNKICDDIKNKLNKL